MALLKLHKEMLQKPPSAPLSNYIFRVNFHLDSIYKDKSLGYSLNNDTDRSMIAIEADLPSFETSIIQKHFFFGIIQKHFSLSSLQAAKTGAAKQICVAFHANPWYIIDISYVYHMSECRQSGALRTSGIKRIRKRFFRIAGPEQSVSFAKAK